MPAIVIFRPGLPLLLAIAMASILTGCMSDETQQAAAVVPPVITPEPAPAPGPTQAEIRKARAERNRAANLAVTKTGLSATSRSQQSYYANVERDLLARGLLRRDRIPQDAPINAERLAQDFIRIALRNEYGRDGTRLVADHHPAPLRRWQAPVRIQLEFGASADAASRARLRSEISAFAGRLVIASGHDVALTGGKGNFTVLLVNDDERRAIGPRLSSLVAGIPPQDIATIRDLAPDNFCTVFAYSQGNSASYVHAVALIRAELPPLLRLSCVHEELAQGMGLANDAPDARPSIFNDDEEFALLTRHDELLLRILYDPRLRPGMSEAEAAPIVRKIAAELLPNSI